MHEVMTRYRVLVNTRHNVRQIYFLRAMELFMKDDWFQRFVAAIEADPRDKKAISLAAKCGPNYVQQMITNGKRPGVDRFISILRVLGTAKSYEILTGIELGPDDADFIRAAAALDPESKASAVKFFQSIQAQSKKQ